ncbi:helix-turn-helix domain-containing protein [Amycolatopsis kentuckyensis]|uniref:helix-turn-helix domain-containing protein n=1 Tax=Amycolatopsis kentuckyensis TaxID=218823 RepID=UPI000A39FD41|nr:helix-turn-helix transcriptional regulator [Amycolatopsis kentuckyensis]
MSTPDWPRLGAYVTSRRSELYKTVRDFSKAVGISEKTLGKLELGQSVSRTTLAAVERAFGWAPGSCAAILAGGEPRMLTEANDAAVAAARAEVLAMTPDELAQMQARIGAVQGPEHAEEWLRRVIELRRSDAAQGSSSPQTTRREVG